MQPAALIDPSPSRAEDLDTHLRTQLSSSIEYLADYLSTSSWDGPQRVRPLLNALKRGPVSPWVFGLYAWIVRLTSRREIESAQTTLDLLCNSPVESPRGTIISLSDPGLSDLHREVAHYLVDTDAQRSFHPRPPTEEDYQACCAQIVATRNLLADLDPDLAREIDELLRLIIVATPSDSTPEQSFNGVSTFFLWGATILNARSQTGPVRIIDSLVHESSHLLLFGLVSGGALSDNDPAARYPSPLRTDPRPIDGVIHATFVSTRIHRTMKCLWSSPACPEEFKGEMENLVLKHAEAAESGLELLQQHMQPTAAGAEILDALSSYWQAVRSEAA